MIRNIGLDELREEIERFLPADVASLDRNNRRHSLLRDVQLGSARSLLQRDRRLHFTGQVRGVASTLVLAELLVLPFAKGDRVTVDRYVRRLSTFPNLRLVAPDVAICRTAARLRAERRALRLPDAIHLATAIESKASAFVTNDRDLGEVRELTVLRISALA